jgi:hypothetical protein
MKTRREYIQGLMSHREYYGQFVGEELKQGLLFELGKEAIVNATDDQFNNIRLITWDTLYCTRAGAITDRLVACGDFPSMAGLLCIAKEGARQLREEFLC